MPYTNVAARKNAQQDSPTLRRTFAHLTKGTRPGRKEKNIKDLRRYINVASLDDNGLLIVKKSDAFVAERKLIIVPCEILPGLISALHIQLNHPTKHQLQKLFNRHFYGLNSNAVISNVTHSCHLCESLKKIPKEVLQQSSTPSPEQPGTLYHADVVRRKTQKIFVARDAHSSFTTASLIANEKHDTLRTAIIENTSLFREKNIQLTYGHVKNTNKTAVIDKGIQEVELALLKLDPSGSPVSNETLQAAVNIVNHKVRNRGLSAYEILFQRDQHTGTQLKFNDKELALKQQELREKNHRPSALSKAKGGPTAMISSKIGELVFVKHEGDKFTTRDTYIIANTEGEYALLRKLSGSVFGARKYKVPLTSVFPIATRDSQDNYESTSSSTSESEDEMQPPNDPVEDNNISDDEESLDNDDEEENDSEEDWSRIDEDENQHQIVAPTTNRRPQRTRRKPPWHEYYTPHRVISEL